MNVRYRLELSQSERAELMRLMSGGKQAARNLKRAQILLAANAGVSDEDIAASVGVGGSTVYRTKRRFVEGNLERALSDAPRKSASSPARRKPCWWRLPARARQPAAPVGRWSCWRAKWSK
jgi:transposase